MVFIFSEVTMVRLAVVEKQLILHTIELRLDVRSARLLATQTSKDCTRPDLYVKKIKYMFPGLLCIYSKKINSPSHVWKKPIATNFQSRFVVHLD